MQIICANCGEKISAEHINIQEMVAVCPHCDNIFKIDVNKVSNTSKRRKIKQPKNLTLRDDDTLQMRFRTNFLLMRNNNFASTAILSLTFSLIAFMLFGEYFAGEIAPILPFSFGLIVFGLYYTLGLIAYNSTEIVMDGDTIKVARTPLPAPFMENSEINLSGVSAIRCEETPLSIKEGYDTPRYNVWAELSDGNRKLIVGDLIYDYGFFVAQRLEERLQLEGDVDSSRLVDDEADDNIDTSEFARQSRSHQHK